MSFVKRLVNGTQGPCQPVFHFSPPTTHAQKNPKGASSVLWRTYCVALQPVPWPIPATYRTRTSFLHFCIFVPSVFHFSFFRPVILLYFRFSSSFFMLFLLSACWFLAYFVFFPRFFSLCVSLFLQFFLIPLPPFLILCSFFYSSHAFLGSRVSSGSIVSDYGLDDWAIGVRSPAGAKDFSSSLCVPPSLLYNGYREVLSPGVKRGRGVTLTTHPI
jgi:hypothetical protein